ncbi:MAG: hypothetical protein PHY47_25200 [Lachnospiraceae bacterium]|nr:hypothetical protein [Lachnospiraceae bacterium]
MEYTEEQINSAYLKIVELLHIVNDLEGIFTGRHFTLDGHLVGSIGEIMAAYYYGIELYEASAPTHDGKTRDGREVQIKITQQDRIVINEKPDYLIVLFLNRKTGEISEIYNGSGEMPWETAYIYEKHNTRYMMISKLLEMDKNVDGENRIAMIHKIEKYEKKKNNIMENSKASGFRKSKTLEIGYVNRNQQENCGCTGKAGNHEGQVLYKMKCLKCDNEYEANGCDVWLRKCPNCMK